MEKLREKLLWAGNMRYPHIIKGQLYPHKSMEILPAHGKITHLLLTHEFILIYMQVKL